MADDGVGRVLAIGEQPDQEATGIKGGAVAGLVHQEAEKRPAVIDAGARILLCNGFSCGLAAHAAPGTTMLAAMCARRPPRV